MAVTKKIEIDGQMVEFRASAAVPRLYRIKFGRDIYKDLRSLEKSVDDGNEESSSLDLFSLEMFENIAYIMAKHAPLFMLRCVQLGISIADLDLLTIGLVNDMFTERQNDEYPYQELASQADFDRL